MLTHQQSGRVGPQVRLVLLALAVGICHVGHADESAEPADPPDYKVPLTDNDLRMITLAVMETHPLVASSPGVKYADGHRSYLIAADDKNPNVATRDAAHVIFHPHTESAGIKEAFQVHCLREYSGGLWSCPHVELRRYVRLETQDFEVRVKGGLSLEGVLALVEATRATARAGALEGSAAADIVTVIIPSGDSYHVAWADKEHQAGVLVEARLSRNGDPTEPGDWKTWIQPSEE